MWYRPANLVLPLPAEGTAEVTARVATARVVQIDRYAGDGVRTNAEADSALLDRVAAPDGPSCQRPEQAAEKMRLSVRGYHRVLSVG